VPAHVRNAPSHRDAWSDDDTDPDSGAIVLVVIGFVVMILIAGIIWLRCDKAPTLFAEESLTTAMASELG
jgi:hypothetical protein